MELVKDKRGSRHWIKKGKNVLAFKQENDVGLTSFSQDEYLDTSAVISNEQEESKFVDEVGGEL